MEQKNIKLCLAASSGGHLLQLYSLKSVWENYPHFWVTFPKEDAESLLAGEKVFRAYFPTNRNAVNFFKNFWLAWKLLRQERPDAVISTGAGIAVPFLWCARLLGMKTVYIESLTRVHELSLTGKLLYFFTGRFFVQWPELAARFPRAMYKGQVL